MNQLSAMAMENSHPLSQMRKLSDVNENLRNCLFRPEIVRQIQPLLYGDRLVLLEVVAGEEESEMSAFAFVPRTGGGEEVERSLGRLVQRHSYDLSALLLTIPDDTAFEMSAPSPNDAFSLAIDGGEVIGALSRSSPPPKKNGSASGV